MKIGVLSLQGAFIEHKKIIEKLGAECTELRQRDDIEGIDGVILPGGESTVQGKLLKQLGMHDILKEKIENGLPVLATCAGLILISSDIENDSNTYLATLPVTVKRNAYGRQLASFSQDAALKGFDHFPMVFIRAPYISHTGNNVDVLASIDDNIVGVQYQNQIGLSFHPELTEDYRIHQHFIDMVSEYAHANK
jgi:5'-phosphate synthase pdxT subunit